MWFEALTGFQEESPEQVRENIVVDDETMTSVPNGRRVACGRLETPSLAELRVRCKASHSSKRTLRLAEVVAEAQSLHRQLENAGALFQVASQFNLLEMVSPSVTPERGVDIYERDPTQGPACAVACGAGTIYRNYFAEVNGRTGQTADNQIDCLRELGEALGNVGDRLWRMRNGYAIASESGLEEISRRLSAMDESERDEQRKQLRIGVQWNAQVTLGEATHTVTQTYGSALPVAYSEYSPRLWAPFAQLVLEASYEATLCAAAMNAQHTGNNKVFLTLLGGGAFGNRLDWIIVALERALTRYSDTSLDIAIVSHGASNPGVRQLCSRLQNTD